MEGRTHAKALRQKHAGRTEELQGPCEWNAESRGEQQERRAASMGPELQVLLRLQVLAQTWGVSWGSTCCLQSLGECGDGVGPGMHFEADLPWTT